AEYLGLINPIGNYVAEQACTQCRIWNEMGADNFHINVNLSVVQLLQNDIVEVVQNAIRTSGIKPENLTLEVTESLAINDLDRTKDILDRIKALGVRLALDDFGTGYSSLNNIRVLPFDIIKVDQNFVKDLADDNYSQSFIRMVAELGEAIGAEICVEGIETRSQYRILEGMHVRYIQGVYFNQPLSREEFEALYIAKGKEKPRLKK
ncbi:MAG: EAL domain-containing protein, partial [Lachnospiraceae bacterium]|nr:EAL domain-containing protein [Lachnospiraceae bacterium]